MELFNPIQPLVPSILGVMKYEYDTHAFYRLANNWAANKGYDKAAAYFAKDAAEEIGHATAWQDFLNQWGIVYALPTMSCDDEFESLPDIVRKTYELMVAIYKAYVKLANDSYIVDKSVWAKAMEYVNIQTGAVAYWRTKVDQLALINEDNKLDVLIYEQKAFDNE